MSEKVECVDKQPLGLLLDIEVVYSNRVCIHTQLHDLYINYSFLALVFCIAKKNI